MKNSTGSEPFRAADLAGLPFGSEALFQAAPSPFLVVLPPDYTILAVNEAYLRATMTERAAILGRKLFDVFPGNPEFPSAAGPSEVRASLERVVAQRRTDEMPITRYDIRRPAVLGGGFEERWWNPRNAPVIGPDGEVVCIIHNLEDVTARVRAEQALREHSAWLKGQGEALLAAVDNAPLAQSLGALVRTAIETLGEGVRGAFYLADGEGEELHHVVGMGDEYGAQVDGFKIGPESLACGLATHTGEPVLTVDVQTDERWKPWTWLAERFDYRGCWSFPIHSTAGAFVGTLALYWREPRKATARELQFASLMTNTAAIIIARHHEAEVRKQAENALRSSLAEREALLAELHHRVKNNLQVVTSLLEMQVRQAPERPATASLTEARNRITAIASIHELLYQSGSFSDVDLGAYARRLLRHVVSLYDGESRVDALVDGDGITIDLARAVPMGLLLNELVSNAYKHAFAPGSAGNLRIGLHREDGHVRMSVADSGVGLPDGIHDRLPATLGLQLVRMLTKQLGGTVEFESNGGTNVEVRVPIKGTSA